MPVLPLGLRVSYNGSRVALRFKERRFVESWRRSVRSLVATTVHSRSKNTTDSLRRSRRSPPNDSPSNTVSIESAQSFLSFESLDRAEEASISLTFWISSNVDFGRRNIKDQLGVILSSEFWKRKLVRLISTIVCSKRNHKREMLKWKRNSR